MAALVVDNKGHYNACVEYRKTFSNSGWYPEMEAEMSLVPIFEIHQRRIIPFPEELLQGKGAFPLRCKLHLGLTAAAMLFPRDPEDFAGYMAQEMTFLISLMEMMEVEFQKKSSIEFIELPRYLYGSRTNFLEYSRWQGFSEKGKGSLEERVFQGQFCGSIYFLHTVTEKPLKEVINLIIKEHCNIRGKMEHVFPFTVSLDNIQNNIWPRFKDVAWLWAPLCYHSIPMDSQRIDLDDLSMVSNIFDGGQFRNSWYGFVDGALRFYQEARDNEKRAGTSPPVDGSLWYFSFQLDKK